MADNNNKLLVPGAENAMNNMKEEIANEFGVQLGADTTARANGSVGGEMVKRMISIAEQSMQNNQK
ncbi:alpha/beta-type small acid-soluble spore protein [Aquibacillus kalidii]|uniref:alpha/beta-type small acid-soluble spore protein n=1 Tax=Aquibacillus kalidii TaxID=2762597 RepID=UPI0016462095|nr:alpha/beta-type small acid-soluble spore protein [Aquibacillus kalidii]